MKCADQLDAMDLKPAEGLRIQREVYNPRFRWFEEVEVEGETTDEQTDFRAWDVDWLDAGEFGPRVRRLRSV